MDKGPVTESSLESVETTMRDELAQGDSVLSTVAPIMRHLLANEDQALFSDEIVARVHGMLADVARQMLFAQAEVAKAADRAAFAEPRSEALVAELANDPAFLGHLHTLTIEGQLTRKLQNRTGLDPVLSPLLQELVAAKDDAMAAAAMSAIAAQARFMQQLQRMAMPLGELPGDLFHHALIAFRRISEGDEHAKAAERKLRDGFDESLGRIGLLAKLVMRLGKNARRSLDVDTAGLAVFATGLAMAAGQDRDVTVLAFSDRQYARFALALRAAGLKSDALEEQFLYLHPEVSLPENFDHLTSERAAALLAASDLRSGE
ncbi:hypothetical protein GRI89_08560 [Altererythrobacter salegens]|uniref:Uncharacterized protein n=1 Tax=Croceibacterium salegens TaxID=1737568 RepID=A0A6I4SZ99_9SPHN|nr:hypothetical protein [Croceibacterium salegens]MXO59592.1 hypothetical protein [Croceibacterium salegens]